MADDKLRATPAFVAEDLGINLYDISGSGTKQSCPQRRETYKDANGSHSTTRKTDTLNNCLRNQGTGHRGRL